jgi:ribosomal protein S18 acetylase RimI-like enzyme
MRHRIDIVEAKPGDAAAIAEIHLTSRRDAMPYLHLAHSDDSTRAWFAKVVGDRPLCWWVARYEGQSVGYMRVVGDELDHLYVRPDWQRRSVGLALVLKAKSLSPARLVLWTFQRNTNARAFYEAQGFGIAGCTDGDNEEHEPDVRYVWDAASDPPEPCDT